METIDISLSFQDALRNMASEDSKAFSTFFRRARKMFPVEVTQGCLCYLANKGLDAAGQKMALWLIAENRYAQALLDPDGLPDEAAVRAAAVIGKMDPRFCGRFLKEAEKPAATAHLLRALDLVPGIADNALLPWLQTLTRHADESARIRALTLLTDMRPDEIAIQQQLQDRNARVRANAIEMLWHLQGSEATEIFKNALFDSNHRVVANALVGLHLQGIAEAFAKMMELCESPHAATRRAMAWSLGYVQDDRGIVLLRALSQDPVPTVRARALRSLLSLETARNKASEMAAA